MFFPYLMSKWIYLKYFEIFKMAAIWGFGLVFKPEVVTCYALHVELLFDVLAQILRELWLFQNLTYFLTSWPSYLTFDLKNYRVLCCGRLHMWTKFGDDWSKTATFIAENVTISFKHEYRRPTLTSRCDVISDVINIRGTFWVNFGRSFHI